MPFPTVQINTRSYCQKNTQSLVDIGLTPLQARIISARCENPSTDINWSATPLSILPNPEQFKDGQKAAERLVLAIKEQQHIGLLTDYDVDGITSHAILHRALHECFGHPKSHLHAYIGHRIEQGYGISEKLVDDILANKQLPDVIISADCGSSDEARIQRLKDAGIDVIVTDHHAMPADGAPKSAFSTINPTQADCPYPDSVIAGCMVAWLMMCLLRQTLIKEKRLEPNKGKLAYLLDYVALGTVADAVTLGHPSNRAVVQAGLCVLNQRQKACWQAFAQITQQGEKPFTTEDLGFALGPRINARSRMADPYAAMHCLLADDLESALHYGRILDEDNQRRKQVERQMLKDSLVKTEAEMIENQRVIVVSDESYHPGVQGIVASRLVERWGMPTVVLAPKQDSDEFTGSARSIDSCNIKESLDQLNQAYPGLLLRYGGHSGAAGLSIKKIDLKTFAQSLNCIVLDKLPAPLSPILWHDGSLEEQAINLATYQEINALAPYGRGFPAPVFVDSFQVINVRTIGSPKVHLALSLERQGQAFRAVYFNALNNVQDPLPCVAEDCIEVAYQLSENHFRNQTQLQLQIQSLIPLPVCAELNLST